MRHPLAPVLIAFLALGTVYLLTTPPFEAPDEIGHYAYVRYLVEQRRLPPLVIADNEWDQGQMHQPPLYYALGALLVGHLDEPGWEAAYPRNPFAALGQPRTLGNRNAVIHPLSPTPPAQQTARALWFLRAFSLGCSAVSVWLAYRLALTVLPEQRWLAVGSAALLAFNPQFLFIGASANNDVLVTTLSAATLLLAAHVARDGGRPYATPLALGVLGALAALSKLSGLATLALAPAAYLLYPPPRAARRLWPDLLRPLSLCALAAVCTGGWWYLRNAMQYRDALGMRMYAHIFAAAEGNLPLSEALRTTWEALASYWGVFGWLTVAAPERCYQAIRALTLLAGLGLAWRGASVLRAKRWPPPATLRAGAVALLWGTLVLALLVRWSQTIGRTQGRLAFPASGVYALALALGLTAWLPHRWRPWALGGTCALLLAAAVAAPWALIAPAYAPPRQITAEELPPELPRLDLRYGDGITLLAAEVLSEEAKPGGTVWVRLYWRAERPVPQSYAVAALLVSPDGARLGGLDTLPAMGRAPTHQWQPGAVIVDECALPVDANAVGPLALGVRVALYAERYDEALPVSDGAGTFLGSSAEIARVRLAPPNGEDTGAPQVAVAANLANRALLVGYDLAAVTREGETLLELGLHWECLAPMRRSYTVFVHLLGPDGELVDQEDAAPLGGAFPTTFWRPGDRLYEARRLRLAPDYGGEPLALHLGMYLTETGERLPLEGSDPPTDHVVIGPFRVAAGRVVADE